MAHIQKVNGLKKMSKHRAVMHLNDEKIVDKRIIEFIDSYEKSMSSLLKILVDEYIQRTDKKAHASLPNENVIKTAEIELSSVKKAKVKEKNPLLSSFSL
jgi:flagellar capping protein FliD